MQYNGLFVTADKWFWISNSLIDAVNVEIANIGKENIWAKGGKTSRWINALVWDGRILGTKVFINSRVRAWTCRADTDTHSSDYSSEKNDVEIVQNQVSIRKGYPRGF
ncbi:uncharacterized protein LOC132268114 [Cornus florida]|uniref:uncharacterized protein LOC132268114 n=1 Tax=Cornus florida TaxID=4283 RepID=UPI00289A4488|nr:uncharacterized protein LOC132268114 [Cornus florida]